MHSFISAVGLLKQWKCGKNWQGVYKEQIMLRNLMAYFNWIIKLAQEDLIWKKPKSLIEYSY